MTIMIITTTKPKDISSWTFLVYEATVESMTEGKWTMFSVWLKESWKWTGKLPHLRLMIKEWNIKDCLGNQPPVGHLPTFHAGKLHEKKTQKPGNCLWKNSDPSLCQLLKIKALNVNQLWTHEVILKSTEKIEFSFHYDDLIIRAKVLNWLPDSKENVL